MTLHCHFIFLTTMPRRYVGRRGGFLGAMAQDLGTHAMRSGAQAFKDTVTPAFVTKLVTKGVNMASNAIARKFGGQRRGKGIRYVGRRMQRTGRRGQKLSLTHFLPYHTRMVRPTRTWRR